MASVSNRSALLIFRCRYSSTSFFTVQVILFQLAPAARQNFGIDSGRGACAGALSSAEVSVQGGLGMFALAGWKVGLGW